MQNLDSFTNIEAITEIITVESSVSNFSTPPSGASLVKQVDLSSTLIILTYLDTATGYGKVVAGTKNADFTITWGTPVTFNSGTFSWCTPIRVSDTKFCIAYTDGLTTYGTSIFGTVSGTTITISTKLAFNATATYVVGVTLLDTDKVIIAYAEGTTNCKAIVATVSGTTISYGSEALVYTGNIIVSALTNAKAFQQISTLSTTTAIIAHQYTSSNAFISTVVLSISGTTITVNTPNNYDTGASSTLQVAVEAINSTTFVVQWHHSTGNVEYVTLYTISGTTITKGNSTALTSGTYANNGYIHQLKYIGGNRFIATTGADNYGVQYLHACYIAAGTIVVNISLSTIGRRHINYLSGTNLLTYAYTQSEGFPYVQFIDVSTLFPSIEPVRYLIITAGANEQIEISSLYAKNAGILFSATNRLQLYKGGTTPDKCFYDGGYSDQFSPTTSAPCVPMTLANNPIILDGGESLYASFTGSYYGIFTKGSIFINGLKRS